MKRSNTKAILLVILCTVFTSLGQILWKAGSKNIAGFSGIITNIPLLLGFVAYGVGAILLIYSLKLGDLSVVYPFISLSFIWVGLSSIILFHETINLLNWVGILSILVGVSLVAYGGRK